MKKTAPSVLYVDQLTVAFLSSIFFWVNACNLAGVKEDPTSRHSARSASESSPSTTLKWTISSERLWNFSCCILHVCRRFTGKIRNVKSRRLTFIRCQLRVTQRVPIVPTKKSMGRSLRKSDRSSRTSFMVHYTAVALFAKCYYLKSYRVR